MTPTPPLARPGLRAGALLGAGLALLLALAPRAAADVLTVGPAGAHAGIQDAVDAAADGDVILVASGEYAAVTITNKALTVVADTGALVQVRGGLVVQSLSPGRNVVLRGLEVDNFSSTGPFLAGLSLFFNQGSLRVETCRFEGNSQLFTLGANTPGARVLGCSDAAFRDCVFVGGNGGSGGLAGAPGSPGLDVEGSEVTLHGGEVHGGVGAFGGNGPTGSVDEAQGNRGGPALRLRDASLFASGVPMLGGSGGGGGTCGGAVTEPGDGGSGGHAVELMGASALFRNQRCELEGGPGGPGGDARFPLCLSSGSAGPDGEVLLEGGGLHLTVPGTPRGFDALMPQRENVPFGVALEGLPGEFVALLNSPAVGTSYEPGAQGQLLLSTLFDLELVGVVPPSGTLAFATSFPSLGPGVEGLTLFVQSLFVDGNGQLTLGPGLAPVVVDASF